MAVEFFLISNPVTVNGQRGVFTRLAIANFNSGGSSHLIHVDREGALGQR